MCGQTLPAADFGYRAGGPLLRAYCKSCNNLRNREKYRHPIPKHKLGDVFRKPDGTLWEYTAAHWKRYWSPSMLNDLRINYNTMTNEELASMLGVPYGTLNRKARELGLKKSKSYIADVARRHLALAHAENVLHGNPGQIKPGEHRGRTTEFKNKNI